MGEWTIGPEEAAAIFERSIHWLRIRDYRGEMKRKDGTPILTHYQGSKRRRFTADELEELLNLWMEIGVIRSVRRYRRIEKRIQNLRVYHQSLPEPKEKKNG